MHGEIQLLEKQSLVFTSAKVLFVCTANIQRSLTAEHLCAKLYPEFSFKSAGVSRRECERNKSQLCSLELLEWADGIFVFEQMQINRIKLHTGDRFLHKINNLEIEDCYQYMQTDLIDIILEKLLKLPLFINY